MSEPAFKNDSKNSKRAFQLSIWRAGKFAALGLVLLAALVVLVIIDVAPHDPPYLPQPNAPLLALVAAQVVISILILRAVVSAYRERLSAAMRLADILPLGAIVGYMALVTICLVQSLDMYTQYG